MMNKKGADSVHTIESARTWAVGEFKRAGVESSTLSADLLLGFATGRNRVYVLSHAEDRLSDECWIRYRALVTRHAGGEPLQYLTGQREFYGLDFRVTPAVLIPRPETEILVEAALGIIRRDFDSGAKFADIGTGSGCIAVSVIHESPACRGWATDSSGQALAVAHGNAVQYNVSGRIHFIQADLLECFVREPVFDLVLSNPPYVPLEDYDTLPVSVKNFEPHRALFGGADGLQVFRRLVPEAYLRVKPGGFLLMEAGAGQAEAVSRLIEDEGFALERILDDLQGIPRCLVARKSRVRGNG